MNSNKTFVLHVFTDWIFPFTTWRLLHWACQKASAGWGRVPPTRRIQEAEARHPRDEGANLWIKGYCTLSPHWMGEFVLLYFFFYETCYYSNLFSLPHSVVRKYVPLYISFLCTHVCIINRKRERNLLLPCHIGWWYLYGISNAEFFLSLFLIP